MDKNNDLFINYYVDWKTTDWLKDLFDSNGLEWNDIFEGEIDETPGRAPSLNNKQNGI
jgi:hypothetical protein